MIMVLKAQCIDTAQILKTHKTFTMDVSKLNQLNTLLVMEEPRGPSQLIEILIPAQIISVVQIPVIQNLQNQTDQIVILKALRVIPDSILTNGPTSGLVNATLAELQKISLVIYSQEWIKGQLIPVCTLIDTFTEGSGIPFSTRTKRFDSWKDVNWGKSSLQYSNGAPSSGAAYCIIFEAEYQKFKKTIDGLVEIQGIS